MRAFLILPLVALLAGMAIQSSEESEYLTSPHLTVVIEDHAGSTLSGATVTLSYLSPGAPWETTAIADDEGSIEFTLQEPGLHEVFVQLEGFIPVLLGPFEIDQFDRPSRTVPKKVTIVLVPTWQIGCLETPGDTRIVLL